MSRSASARSPIPGVERGSTPSNATCAPGGTRSTSRTDRFVTSAPIWGEAGRSSTTRSANELDDLPNSHHPCTRAVRTRRCDRTRGGCTRSGRRRPSGRLRGTAPDGPGRCVRDAPVRSTRRRPDTLKPPSFVAALRVEQQAEVVLGVGVAGEPSGDPDAAPAPTSRTLASLPPRSRSTTTRGHPGRTRLSHPARDPLEEGCPNPSSPRPRSRLGSPQRAQTLRERDRDRTAERCRACVPGALGDTPPFATTRFAGHTSANARLASIPWANARRNSMFEVIPAVWSKRR